LERQRHLHHVRIDERDELGPMLSIIKLLKIVNIFN
jgi:hypothetical protein